MKIQFFKQYGIAAMITMLFALFGCGGGGSSSSSSTPHTLNVPMLADEVEREKAI